MAVQVPVIRVIYSGFFATPSGSGRWPVLRATGIERAEARRQAPPRAWRTARAAGLTHASARRATLSRMVPSARADAVRPPHCLRAPVRQAAGRWAWPMARARAIETGAGRGVGHGSGEVGLDRQGGRSAPDGTQRAVSWLRLGRSRSGGDPGRAHRAGARRLTLAVGGAGRVIVVQRRKRPDASCRTERAATDRRLRRAGAARASFRRRLEPRTREGGDRTRAR